MSARKRRAAFDPNALNDLDDVLPPLNLVRDAAAAGSAGEDSAELTVPEAADVVQDQPRSSQSGSETPPQSQAIVTDDEPALQRAGQIETAPIEADDKQSPTRRADARRKSARRDASTVTNRVAPPEVALPEEIYSALRSLTLEERSVDPTTARSYGHVVLDAVERHAAELQTHWASSTASSSGGGLFKRAEAGRPTRRRHNAPRARVPLAGVINADAAVLDQLASDWGAGSRSALVEQALRLYLRVD